MVCLSVFSQAASGSTYGIVPYVDPPATGSIAGIVGAGGNTGAVIFGLGFRSLSYKNAFVLMGCVILGTSILSIFVVIKGQAGLIWGKATLPAKVSQTLAVPKVPEVDAENAEGGADHEESNKKEVKEEEVEKSAAALPTVDEEKNEQQQPAETAP
jgi:NNP family nitrate/nitrite transporter-like MFS transporter